jgi:hypothetical protein
MDREALPVTAASQPARTSRLGRFRSLKAAAMIALLAGVVAPTLGVGGVTGCSTTQASGTAGADVSSIIFIKRVTEIAGTGSTPPVIDVAGGNGQVIDYTRFEPGGSLNLLAPARVDGTVTNLTADFPTADFNGADVSFDATSVVFSMKKDPNDSYHIYTVSLTPGADGKYEVHQLTAGSQDDFNPIYLPGQLIAFATNQMYTAMGTRADEYEHSRIVSQLATISVAGGDADRHLFPQSLSHTVSLFMRHDGKLGYSRWEHLGGTNDVKLFTANPDGTKMIAVGGQHGKPSNSLISVRESAPNVMVGIATNRERTIHAGALVQIDARNQSDPTCLDPNADETGHACLDEEHAQFTVLTPNVPVGSDPSPVGRYREPSPLPDGRILTSWAPGAVNDLDELSATPPDFGIYIFDPTTQTNELVYNDQKTWDLNAMAVIPRTEPPTLASTQTTVVNTDPVMIGSVDITNTSLVETVQGAQYVQPVSLATALKDAVAVRIIEGFSSEAAKGVMKFGLTMDEGAAVLGTAPVYPDGSWLAQVPPYIPMHVQPIDKFGIAIRNQRLWIQGAPGEDRRCVGCHESRTGQGVPAFGANPTVAEQQKVIPNFTEAIADRTEYPWAGAPTAAKNVQTLLTAKCAGCHNGSTTTYYDVSMTDPLTGKATVYRVPTLDLTDTPVTVYYDEGVTTWPASYVSIFYPATLSMGGMMGPKLVSGVIPPMWGIPEDARNSVLIQKMNVKAPSDGTVAWPGAKFHPEDQGASFSLTDDERQMLIRTMDLGGQYWARQNTGFAPFNHDPTGL